MYYDVVVLGAGPGGYVSAIRASQLGAKTAIVEKNQVGGTCLNAGCIPTKALLKNVEILHCLELGKQRGIDAQEVQLDYRKAIKAKNGAVRQLVKGVEGLLASNDVDLYRGKGCVKENQVISIASSENKTQMIRYGKLIIATGSKPATLPIKGVELEGVVFSEEMLGMDTVPERLIIIGGGVIGCELANVLNAYGSHVTIVEMLPGVVAMLDEDISHYMEEVLRGQGINLKLGKQVNQISNNDDGMLKVFITDHSGEEEILYGNQVLLSIGRQPNLEGLESLNLETERGYIKVNEKLETSQAGVYAIGDVTGKKLLAHVASEMGIRAAENAMGFDRRLELDIIPSCIYTIPEIGTVGLSESEARLKGYSILIGKFPLLACGKAVATGEAEGIFKLIADKDTRKLLGAHLIGKSATELVSEMSAYMKMGAKIDDVIDTIHAHPTISEAIVEAARDIDGNCIHMPKR